MTAPATELTARDELLENLRDWTRQVAAREDIPRGVRSAAANLHADCKRIIESEVRALAAAPTEPLSIADKVDRWVSEDHPRASEHPVESPRESLPLADSTVPMKTRNIMLKLQKIFHDDGKRYTYEIFADAEALIDEMRSVAYADGRQDERERQEEIESALPFGLTGAGIRFQAEMNGASMAAVDVARGAAFADRKDHEYLPQTEESAKQWEPHTWVIRAMQRYSEAMVLQVPVAAAPATLTPSDTNLCNWPRCDCSHGPCHPAAPSDASVPDLDSGDQVASGGVSLQRANRWKSAQILRDNGGRVRGYLGSTVDGGIDDH